MPEQAEAREDGQRVSNLSDTATGSLNLDERLNIRLVSWLVGKASWAGTGWWTRELKEVVVECWRVLWLERKQLKETVLNSEMFWGSGSTNVTVKLKELTCSFRFRFYNTLKLYLVAATFYARKNHSVAELFSCYLETDSRKSNSTPRPGVLSPTPTQPV